MNRSLKGKLLAATAIVAVLAGGALAAVTAAGEGPLGHAAGTQRAEHQRGDSNLSIAARYLGSSPAQLQSELGSGKTLAEIADATSGKSAAGLIEALVKAKQARLAAASAKLPERVAREVNATGGRGRGSVAAHYLGLSAPQLRSELSSGKSLAQIADATAGKSAAGLIEAIVSKRKARLAAQVNAGALTRSQENARLAAVTGKVTARVNRVHLGAANALRPSG
jgi:hypothetical protein